MRTIPRLLEVFLLREASPDGCTCGATAAGGGKHSDWCDLGDGDGSGKIDWTVFKGNVKESFSEVGGQSFLEFCENYVDQKMAAKLAKPAKDQLGGLKSAALALLKCQLELDDGVAFYESMEASYCDWTVNLAVRIGKGEKITASDWLFLAGTVDHLEDPEFLGGMEADDHALKAATEAAVKGAAPLLAISSKYQNEDNLGDLALS